MLSPPFKRSFMKDYRKLYKRKVDFEVTKLYKNSQIFSISWMKNDKNNFR